MPFYNSCRFDLGTLAFLRLDAKSNQIIPCMSVFRFHLIRTLSAPTRITCAEVLLRLGFIKHSILFLRGYPHRLEEVLDREEVL